MSVTLGQKVPDFKAAATGETFVLSARRGTIVVLYLTLPN